MSSRNASATLTDRLAWIATAYPARASASTIARPMRRAPPVTSAAGGDAAGRADDMSVSMAQIIAIGNPAVARHLNCLIERAGAESGRYRGQGRSERQPSELGFAGFGFE